MKKKTIIKSILVALATLLATVTLLVVGLPATAATETLEYTDELGELMEQASSFVVVYHKQLGGSHYAYTEAVSDHLNDGRQWGGESGIEANWNPGSKITLVTLTREGDKVKKTENRLINSTSGVLRDPCISEDGTKMVYSYKENAQDDYHLYEYTFATKEKKQLTFGSGVADIEPVYTANGNIVFSSTRDIQTVDCWHTDVSNLYTCNADGSNITRLGYDQVHTTYPTTTSDGRILYTRWDYNDRSQMYVQSVFQMFQDGTLQTEVFGNDVSNPTTLLHTREIPGVSGKYISIVSGHHTHQVGKLVTVDTSLNRNDKSALKYVWTDSATTALQNSHNNDTGHYYDGKVFKYPIAISEDVFLVSSCDSGYSGRETPFNIELIYGRNQNLVLVEGSANFPASQVALVKNNPQFNRASLVNYNNNYGTYYVGNVYEGEAMEGVAAGTVKYLRVVALEFRSSAIGATIGRGTGTSDPYSPIATGNGSWDVKKVLGIVDVYSDGSAMFTAPSETPLYFQLLDKNGDMIQTMRSWSTLQPGEYFSCVGCHLDKNVAPSVQAGITEAMKAGVQEIRPDMWMEAVDSYEDQDAYDSSTVQGFDYLEVVQPILDANCISCHSDSSVSYSKINASAMNTVDLSTADTVISQRDDWSYTTTAPSGSWTSTSFDSSGWDVANAPFGKIGTEPGMINTIWKSTGSIWLRKTVTLTQYDLDKCAIVMNAAYTDK
ncbi:MAG: PD40 domain-containing protein, partial [Clostridia bacterium]|nr:PD40 domain-containing protein [Clostridia bacterium]